MYENSLTINQISLNLNFVLFVKGSPRIATIMFFISFYLEKKRDQIPKWEINLFSKNLVV